MHVKTAYHMHVKTAYHMHAIHVHIIYTPKSIFAYQHHDFSFLFYRTIFLRLGSEKTNQRVNETLGNNKLLNQQMLNLI